MTRVVPALMIQGTASNAGKSTLVAGLCRLFARRGLSVRPFKPQNMSNNAAVAADGGEIGRAQALQARACGVRPSVHMNPVLLKPQTDVGAQVVVQGRVLGACAARDYGRLKPTLLPRVLESFHALSEDADLVLVEGAGSPAEVNLREGDIANMGFALAAGVPAVLAGDIDRGGVIASLVGTHLLLTPAERRLLKGYLVNKFRGDPTLFDDAHGIIRRHTGWRSFGVVPWCPAVGRLPAEDSFDFGTRRPVADRAIRVAVPVLGRTANFDDLDPLAAEPDVALDLIPSGRPLPADADLVILPGSKATRADLAHVVANGWDVDLRAHVRRGGRVLGLCGGYQILGVRVADPLGIEGPAGDSPGLGLLDVATVLTADKTLEEAEGTEIASGETVRGYEMHMGRTEGADAALRPLLRLGGRADGAVSADGLVMGCYLHGLFASDAFRHVFLNRLRPRASSGLVFEREVEGALDDLADHLETHLDVDGLFRVAGERVGRG